MLRVARSSAGERRLSIPINGGPDSGQAAISFELLHFLQVWLTRHINESDNRFGQHFVKSSDLNAYSQWSDEVRTTMEKKKWWWKFW